MVLDRTHHDGVRALIRREDLCPCGVHVLLEDQLVVAVAEEALELLVPSVLGSRAALAGVSDSRVHVVLDRTHHDGVTTCALREDLCPCGVHVLLEDQLVVAVAEEALELLVPSVLGSRAALAGIGGVAAVDGHRRFGAESAGLVVVPHRARVVDRGLTVQVVRVLEVLLGVLGERFLRGVAVSGHFIFPGTEGVVCSKAAG